MTNKRQFTLRLEEDNFKKVKAIADSSKRSIAMQIEFIIESFIKDYEKVNGKIEIQEKQ